MLGYGESHAPWTTKLSKRHDLTKQKEVRWDEKFKHCESRRRSYTFSKGGGLVGALVVLIFFLIGVWCVLGAVGAWLAEQRRRPRGVGFAFGFFLGPIGLVIVALLPYGPETLQMPTHRRTPLGAGAPYEPAPTSPRQTEWKSQQQWRALGPAAAALPEPFR